ncbi:MAG: hypothetical protein EOO44_02380 [Flavobacterium sp.]|nr:MAG: hypothetical protein EOO44_02380 [Flavobacterium sp.]
MTPLKFAIIASVLSYLVLNSIVVYKTYHHKTVLSKFDLNHDGFFTKNEMTKQQQIAFKRVVNDSGRNLAPITLIPVACFFGFLIYFTIKLFNRYGMTNDNVVELVRVLFLR